MATRMRAGRSPPVLHISARSAVVPKLPGRAGKVLPTCRELLVGIAVFPTIWRCRMSGTTVASSPSRCFGSAEEDVNRTIDFR